MNGNNSKTKEGFIKELGHPRKQELAGMIFDGKTEQEMLDAGFGRINVLEMAREIKNSVEGMEGLSIDIPRNEKETPVEETNPTNVGVDHATGKDTTVTAPNQIDVNAVNARTEAEVANDANTSAPVSSETVPTPTAETVVNPETSVAQTDPNAPVATTETDPNAPTA